jgi:hypothetical protein
MATTETLTDPATVGEVIRLYNVVETGQPEITTQPSAIRPPSQNNDQSTASSPRDWPSDWQRMPPYRAASRSHSWSERPAGVSTAEEVITTLMFAGVWTYGVRITVYSILKKIGLFDLVMQSINKIWRMTAGKLNSNIMRFPVGGEW